MTLSTQTGPIEVLTFGLDEEIFAIEATQVREILDVAEATEVPGAPDFVNQILNVRGRVVPLADLRLKFDMEPRPLTVDSRTVVIETEMKGEAVMVGLLADKVFEVTELAADALETAPRIGMRWRPEYVRSIGKRGSDFIILLNLDRVLASGESERGVPRAAAESGATGIS